MKKFQKINPGTEIPSEPKWKEPVGDALVDFLLSC